jgi:TIR domain
MSRIKSASCPERDASLRKPAHTRRKGDKAEALRRAGRGATTPPDTRRRRPLDLGVEPAPGGTKAFLSHKTTDKVAAKGIADALKLILPKDQVFLSEEIGKAEDYRDAIRLALAQAEFFILLYSDPVADWSWCFYEAGAFSAGKPGAARPIFCLLPVGVEPPSPLANLQCIPATPEDIEQWIRDSLCPILRCRQPNADDLAKSIEAIEKLVNGGSPLRSRMLKPFISIEPSWPGANPRWNDISALPQIDFANAVVSVDQESAQKLGFADTPVGMKLLPLLRRLDCESHSYAGANAFWMQRFFDSLRAAVENRLELQEVAFFRHESGKILRPVVVGTAKSQFGTKVKLSVIFAQSFSVPLTDNPTKIQRLADGVRLGVRTRLEILDKFKGRLADMHRDRMLSRGPEDEIKTASPVGLRVLLALDAIWQEAMAHGFRPDQQAPTLFERADEQTAYEVVRNRGVALWTELKAAAAAEDGSDSDNYSQTERLLGGLEKLNDAYIKLALPRLQALLGAAAT